VGNGHFLALPFPIMMSVAMLGISVLLTRKTAIGLFIESVGDNQTVQVVIKTVLGKLAERVAAEAAYRVLYKVPDKATLADLVQRYIDELSTSPDRIASE